THELVLERALRAPPDRHPIAGAEDVLDREGEIGKCVPVPGDRLFHCRQVLVPGDGVVSYEVIRADPIEHVELPLVEALLDNAPRSLDVRVNCHQLPPVIALSAHPMSWGWRWQGCEWCNVAGSLREATRLALEHLHPSHQTLAVEPVAMPDAGVGEQVAAVGIVDHLVDPDRDGAVPLLR